MKWVISTYILLTACIKVRGLKRNQVLPACVVTAVGGLSAPVANEGETGDANDGQTGDVEMGLLRTDPPAESAADAGSWNPFGSAFYSVFGGDTGDESVPKVDIKVVTDASSVASSRYSSPDSISEKDPRKRVVRAFTNHRHRSPTTRAKMMLRRARQQTNKRLSAKQTKMPSPGARPQSRPSGPFTNVRHPGVMDDDARTLDVDRRRITSSMSGLGVSNSQRKMSVSTSFDFSSNGDMTSHVPLLDAVPDLTMIPEHDRADFMEEVEDITWVMRLEKNH